MRLLIGDAVPDTIRCTLCPWSCFLVEGKLGKCKARINKNGNVVSANPNFVTTAIVGPIEQKGIYHYEPGAKILSLGGIGCNLSCGYCQNFAISQVSKAEGQILSPDQVIGMALEEKADGIAFSYNEPLMNYEYVMDVFQKAKTAKLITVLKTSAMIDQHVFAEVCKLTDCMNIDLKGDHKVYKDVCGVNPSWMDHVLLNIGTASFLSHVEISIPVITNFESNVITAISILLMDVNVFPLHLLRFIPDFRMKNLHPMSSWKLFEIAEYLSEDFPYIYIDFAEVPNDTKCKNCNELLLRREGMETTYNALKGDLCPKCNAKQPIVLRDRSCFTTTNAKSVATL